MSMNITRMVYLNTKRKTFCYIKPTASLLTIARAGGELAMDHLHVLHLALLWKFGMSEVTVIYPDY
jgi:hypothetical protein